jgi:hypothetical protein
MTDPVSYILPALIGKEDQQVTPQILAKDLSDLLFSQDLIQGFLVHRTLSRLWRPRHWNTKQS